MSSNFNIELFDLVVILGNLLDNSIEVIKKFQKSIYV